MMIFLKNLKIINKLKKLLSIKEYKLCIGYYHGIFGMQIFIASLLWLWIGMNNIWALNMCRILKWKKNGVSRIIFNKYFKLINKIIK